MMMEDIEIGPDGEYRPFDAEGERGFYSFEEEVERHGLVPSPIVSQQIQLALLDPDLDLSEEYRWAISNLAEAGLLGEGAEIVQPDEEMIPLIIGQLALEGPEFEPESDIDESARIETSPDHPAMIAEGSRERPKATEAEVGQSPPEGNDTVLQDMSDGLEIVGVTLKKTDDGAEITL